ncbi:MAG: methyltransferase [Bacillota bacterium]|jgi:16S rRNA (guanine1207-N2)-methyltransferase
MTDHYYTATPHVGHETIEFTVTLRGIPLKLKSDAGVFSKHRIDNGTKLLIESLRWEEAPRQVLDLGCGYGPIGLVIAGLLPKATIFMSDINERAVRLAKINAARNRITNVRIAAGAGLTPFAGEKFDLIVTNPPIRTGKESIYAMIDASALALNPGGWFVAVVATKQGAKSYERKLAQVFQNVTEWEKGGGYRVVAGKKV